jgi:hypothetical protein
MVVLNAADMMQRYGEPDSFQIPKNSDCNRRKSPDGPFPEGWEISISWDCPEAVCRVTLHD